MSDELLKALGPFYDSDGAMYQLGSLTPGALAVRRREQTVLAMQTGAGEWLYPAWQFTGEGAVHAQLVPVLDAFRGLDGWVAGTWLTNTRDDLGGLSPRQALSGGANPETIAVLAWEDATVLKA